ncbi:hypothetical protein [Dokdonia sp. Hel_I_53]|uniref:hypothetical protein n=1 Tax=Dokdonia sp. Hel_I_53 TaxID=1566287 RepID=UPI00119B46E1|nr:hypothetical protein [Dokdonia sp. Hel_I_53]TVZ52187.1 hypothetical protein OD90_1357 [Dokdonia sp. Hel_I_53]
MKTIKQFMYCAFVALSIFCISCEAEDGTDGVDGQQGVPGQDGEDGNANVLLRTVDPFPAWTAGSYLGAPANTVEISEPLLTGDILNTSLVLVYFQLFNQPTWYPMTLNYIENDGSDQVITFTYEENKIDIYAMQSGSVLDADITKVRYFIIPAMDAGRSANNSEKNIGALKDAGVDISNIYEVMNYFNID